MQPNALSLAVATAGLSEVVYAGFDGGGVFELTLPSAIFSDGFESGETSAWTLAQP